MAIIGDIRSRGKWVMLIMVGLGIFLFLIMSEWSSGASIMRGNKSKVAVINGTSVENTDFETQVQQDIDNYQLSRGDRYQASEEERQQIRDQAWKNLTEKIVLGDVYEKNGLQITADEMVVLVRDPQFVDPQVRQAFTDPSTGIFNEAAVANFIQTLDQDQPGTTPGTKRRQWTLFEKSLKENRYRSKYNNLIAKSFYSPKWLNEMLHQEFNKNMETRAVALNYYSIPDSSVKVTEQDLKEYLNSHAKLFEQKNETRQIRYVTFPVNASHYDSLDADKWMSDKIDELKTTENDTMFFSLYSETPFDLKVYKKSEYPSIYADSVFTLPKGATFGPYYEGKQMKLAKVIDKKMLSDSLQVRHILISGQNLKTQAEADVKRALFDSLFRQLDTLGGNFNALANAYSEDPANNDPFTGLKKGGEQGWVKPGDKPKEYSDAIFLYDEGRIHKVFADNNLYLIQVTRTVPTIPAVRVAFLTKSVIASKTTEDEILGNVTKFTTDNRSKEKFNATADKLPAFRSRQAALGKNDYNVTGIGSGRQVVRWVFEGKKGDVSQPFRVGDQYIVALISDVREKGLPTVEQAKQELEFFVKKEKKAEMLKKKITDAKAANIDALATKLNVPVMGMGPVSFANPNLNGVGFEPAVAGKAFTMAAGKMSDPIVGNNAVYVIQIDKINAAPPLKDYSVYAKMMAQRVYQKVANGLSSAIIDKADIEDNRSNFY